MGSGNSKVCKVSFGFLPESRLPDAGGGPEAVSARPSLGFLRQRQTKLGTLAPASSSTVLA